jgi:hypothetical protein
MVGLTQNLAQNDRNDAHVQPMAMQRPETASPTLSRRKIGRLFLAKGAFERVYHQNSNSKTDFDAGHLGFHGSNRGESWRIRSPLNEPRRLTQTSSVLLAPSYKSALESLVLDATFSAVFPVVPVG